jgi:hypothetical protein
MTLHEAMTKVLVQANRSMTTQEIANELNENDWYKKGDGSMIKKSQICLRAKNYPKLFSSDGKTVSLLGIGKGKEKMSISIEKSKQLIGMTQISFSDSSLIEKVLMNETNYKDISIIDNLVPHSSGLYCIRIKDINNLPKPFNKFLSERQHNIIYIGIASKNLNSRCLNQELRANGHGTFFRSIGAVLGFRPPKGSLINKANKRNYKFSSADEQKIINWINKYLIVNWVEFQGNFEKIETNLIVKYKPLFNWSKNPKKLQLLQDIRTECVDIANNK